MAYLPYADSNYYLGEYDGAIIPSESLNKALKQASRHIDVLTYNRIVFDNLTDFQKGVIEECTCQIADFEYDNADMIESVLQSYSINGVSMSFGNSWNVRVMNGVAIKADTYSLLKTTGLCLGVLR